MGIRVRILGAGGAFSSLSTSFSINENILIDCGESIIKKEINDKFKSPILDNIKHLFITHTHSDHINGLEQFLYYRLISNQFKKLDLTIYGNEDVLNYYKALAISNANPTNNNDLYMPFNFKLLKKSMSTIEIDDLNINTLETKHMKGKLDCFGFIFSNQINPINKVILTGDMDSTHPLISKDILNNQTLMFHDMGWTGFANSEYKFHPTENEVFEKYGYMSQIIGVHTDSKLKYYKKAEVDVEYTI
jgi:hypothetical protein